jgi:hypothetical protein
VIGKASRMEDGIKEQSMTGRMPMQEHFYVFA